MLGGDLGRRPEDAGWEDEKIVRVLQGFAPVPAAPKFELSAEQVEVFMAKMKALDNSGGAEVDDHQVRAAITLPPCRGAAPRGSGIKFIVFNLNYRDYLEFLKGSKTR